MSGEQVERGLKYEGEEVEGTALASKVACDARSYNGCNEYIVALEVLYMMDRLPCTAKRQYPIQVEQHANLLRA